MLTPNTKYYVALVIDERDYVEQISQPMDACQAMWYVENAKRVSPPCRVAAINADHKPTATQIMGDTELKLELGIKS